MSISLFAFMCKAGMIVGAVGCLLYAVKRLVDRMLNSKKPDIY